MNEAMQFLVNHGGPLLFAVVFLEQAGLPLPAMPWLLAAGAVSATGDLNPFVALGFTLLACLLADSLWFFLGRRRGNRVLALLLRLNLAKESCARRAEDFFVRHGMQAVAGAKFLPGVGAVMAPLAGIFRVSVGRFLAFDALGSLVYGSFYLLLGFLFRDQLQRVLKLQGALGLGALGLFLMLIAVYVAFKLVQRRRSRRERELHGTVGMTAAQLQVCTR
jgi:membrane protein DedA with SNARE-associated domain